MFGGKDGGSITLRKPAEYYRILTGKRSESVKQRKSLQQKHILKNHCIRQYFYAFLKQNKELCKNMTKQYRKNKGKIA